MPRGFGRGYLWMYWVTGLPGWMRARHCPPYPADLLYPIVPPMWPVRPYSSQELSREEEARMLEEELQYLEAERDEIEREIAALKKEIENMKKGAD